jgi:hypothetical protein
MGLAEKYRACMAKAVADAVATVNRPLLSEYHQLRARGNGTGRVMLTKAH